MRRADRLFAIVQLLRGGRAVTARRLADRLGDAFPPDPARSLETFLEQVRAGRAE